MTSSRFTKAVDSLVYYKIRHEAKAVYSVVAMSSSQCVNRGRACIVVNRDNYSEYYMCVQWPSTFFAKSLFFAHFKVLLIIALLNNYAHLMYLCNQCCLGTYYL